MYQLTKCSYSYFSKASEYFFPVSTLTLIQDGHFRGCSRIEGPKRSPLPKICHRYPTMMKLGTVIPYLTKIQKIYESRDTPLSSVDISVFHRKSANFVIQEIQI